MYLLQQIPDSLNDYLEVFTHIENPIFISIILVIIFVVTSYAFLNYVIRPLKNAHQTEKENLEQKNLKILALFAEVSPDPLLRLDMNGIIVDANFAARQLNGEGEIIGRQVQELIPLNLGNTPKKGNLNHRNKHYSWYIKKFATENIILLYLRDITENVEYETKLKEVSKYAQNKVELERQRIALELHDGVGQNLSLAKLKLFKFLKNHAEYKETEDLISLNSILDQGINELRRISYNLKPRVLDEMGFAPALISLCCDISNETGLNINHEIQGKISRLDKSIEATLYRISQEALCNIIKHAKATECKVMLKYETDKVKLIISDNGVGFDLDNSGKEKSLGIFNMRQRVEELNGSLKIETAPGQGTILFIEVSSASYG